VDDLREAALTWHTAKANKSFSRCAILLIVSTPSCHPYMHVVFGVTQLLTYIVLLPLSCLGVDTVLGQPRLPISD
jgi:hypothetical protein